MKRSRVHLMPRVQELGTIRRHIRNVLLECSQRELVLYTHSDLGCLDINVQKRDMHSLTRPSCGS
jgi:hypothetical protein